MRGRLVSSAAVLMASVALAHIARAGLLATIVARESNPAMLHRLGFERVMDGNSDRIESMRVR